MLHGASLCSCRCAGTATVGEQIRGASEAICGNITSPGDERALLSQNVLAHIRNLVEGATVRLHAGGSEGEFSYDLIAPGLAFVRSKAKFSFLGRFHKLIQMSSSHYSMDGDASERLMLKYYEYLLRVRAVLRSECGITVLENLESFPLDLDPSMREYHERIAERIEALREVPPGDGARDRYYIHRTRPFFVQGRVFYAVTFYRAVNKVSKFDRIIAFTELDVSDKYSANLTLVNDSIEILGQNMPITIVDEWDVSIRPCEFDNFARLLGRRISARTNMPEYRYLMRRLTARAGTLLDLIDLPDDTYAKVVAAGTAGVARPEIFPVLSEARRIAQAKLPGTNVIRYLMLRMRNEVLKRQYDSGGCDRLSGLKLGYGCIPFDTMPLCTSPWATTLDTGI